MFLSVLSLVSGHVLVLRVIVYCWEKRGEKGGLVFINAFFLLVASASEFVLVVFFIYYAVPWLILFCFNSSSG